MCTWVLRDYNPWIQAGQRARGVGLTPCEKGRGVGLRGCLCLRTKRIRVPPVVGQTPPALASRHALFQEEEEGEGGRGAARDQALPTLDASTGAGIVTHAHTATTQPSLAHAGGGGAAPGRGGGGGGPPVHPHMPEVEPQLCRPLSKRACMAAQEGDKAECWERSQKREPKRTSTGNWKCIENTRTSVLPVALARRTSLSSCWCAARLSHKLCRAWRPGGSVALRLGGI